VVKNLQLQKVGAKLEQRSRDQRESFGSRVSLAAQHAFRKSFSSRSFLLCLLSALIGLNCFAELNAADLRLDDSNPLAMPSVGSYGLRILSPTLLELTLVTSKEPDPARVTQWDFVGDNFQPNLPEPQEFGVFVGGQAVGVQKVGLKRRVLYAPVRRRDLRIGNSLYLELDRPISDGQSVEVKNPNGRHWSEAMTFTASADAMRWSPAIHVNQVGYLPAFSKKAMVGYYLGSLGEMKIPAQAGFKIVEASSGAVVYQGTLTPRLDRGYTYDPLPYQQVFEADFTSFSTPGEYRVSVPGLGVSFPFMINAGTGAAFARTLALGLYHQRCGMKNEFPFTRCSHAECHTASAEIPTMQFQKTQEFLATVSSESKDDDEQPRYSAPQLKDVASSLYPFVTQGKVDVSGGHHDAGDYSKYTINSAGLIHHLVFAADAFPGVGALDNLGLPESGDGKSDILQEAKWEADFLAKMQDADGGFYFLVYPRDRRYEDNVLPDQSDPQVVWPKTTAVTAAAVGALAEAGSSPLFKQQFPAEAALYLQKAQLGWNFLENALARHGKDGAYQRATHYGKVFMHDDELAWAAAAMFAATGNPVYQEKLKAWFSPDSVLSRRWTWWRLYEGYGCAARTYAFAARTGRLSANQLDNAYLAKCDAEIKTAAEDQLRFAQENAYGTSFPDLNKVNPSAAWYFSSERAFDMTVAYQLERKPEFIEAILSNMNYEGGCNPVNVSYLTGLGWKRQRDVVHQYAQNDHRLLPPSGIPQGNLQGGFQYLDPYKGELTALGFPADWAASAPYPFYDRWGDSFNTSTEFVVVDQARSLASLAFIMALTELKDQPWKSASAQITGLPAQVPAEQTVTASLIAPGIDLTNARIVWETRDQEPFIGPAFRFAPRFAGEQWVEVEAQLPDGRRVFAATNFIASFSVSAPANSYQSAPLSVSSDCVALFHLDSDEADTAGHHGSLTLSGRAVRDASNVGWMANRLGGALSVRDCKDLALLTVPGRSLYSGPETAAITLEAMIYVNEFKSENRGNARLLSLYKNYNASLELIEDAYSGPQVKGGTQLGIPASALAGALTLKQWHHVSLKIDRVGYTVKINGHIVGTQPSSELEDWGGPEPATLEIGNFDGWIDEVAIKSLGTIPEEDPLSLVVSKPVIKPDGGIFSQPVPIILQTMTPGAAIRYTTNGANPTVQSQLYENAFTLSTSATIKAKAFVLGLVESDVASATVTIAASQIAESKALFVGTDAETKGTWKNVYGTEGYVIVGNSTNPPAYAEVIVNGNSQYRWSPSTSDVRALQKSATAGRMVECWYSGTSFTMDMDLTDGMTHRLALYFLDWDRVGRIQTVEILDAAGALLDKQTVSSFGDGKYLLWDIQGRVKINVAKVAGPNAVMMGLFFGPPPGPVNPPPPAGGALNSLQRLLNGHVQLNVTGALGQRFVIEASNDLVVWTAIGSQLLTGTSADFVDTDAPLFDKRFYRLVPEPTLLR
jgi:hypothetical protein